MEKHNPVQQTHFWRETLQKEGYRITEPRRVVMEIILQSQIALTSQDIYDRTRELGYSIGIASVYRALEILEDLGLIQQIHHTRGCQAYWPALTGHKHLVICKKCGRMDDFPGCEDLGDLFSRVEEESGFEVHGHWLQLFGLCQNCQSH